MDSGSVSEASTEGSSTSEAIVEEGSDSEASAKGDNVTTQGVSRAVVGAGSIAGSFSPGSARATDVGLRALSPLAPNRRRSRRRRCHRQTD